ncbi:MAG TPA: hypothetical protein VE959_13840 [Bryobacteraceae bacterium]|nr:hypothetical protein [Bryobacteraceae bacterium]
MQTDEVLSPAESSVPETPQFDLGQWLGRHQALACIASYCSAADAHALLAIREQKLYRALGLTWEEFCPRHAGMSKATANRIIENLQEFGDTYFNLTEILKIPAPQYRALQPAIEDNALEFEGRPIPINRENTQQLIEAVQTLRGRLGKQREKTPQSPLLDLQNLLDRTIGQISGAIRRSKVSEREILIFMVDDHASRALDALRQGLGEAEEAADIEAA